MWLDLYLQGRKIDYASMQIYVEFHSPNYIFTFFVFPGLGNGNHCATEIGRRTLNTL